MRVYCLRKFKRTKENEFLFFLVRGKKGMGKMTFYPCKLVFLVKENIYIYMYLVVIVTVEVFKGIKKKNIKSKYEFSFISQKYLLCSRGV